MINPRFGAGTCATVADLELHPLPAFEDQEYELTCVVSATLHVQAKVTVSRLHRCGVCNAQAPLPDADAIWFILQNHDSERLVFNDVEDCEAERDRYPVKGWTKDIRFGLLCAGCTVELETARGQLVAKMMKSKEGT